MEAKIEERLLEPIIGDHQGFDPEKLKKGMIKEMTSMINQGSPLRRSPSIKPHLRSSTTSSVPNGFIEAKEKKSGVAS